MKKRVEGWVKASHIETCHRRWDWLWGDLRCFHGRVDNDVGIYYHVGWDPFDQCSYWNVKY